MKIATKIGVVIALVSSSAVYAAVPGQLAEFCCALGACCGMGCC